MTHKKCSCLSQRSKNNYCDAGKIIDIKKDQKFYQADFFSLVNSSMDKLRSFQGEKNIIFFSGVQGSKRKVT